MNRDMMTGSDAVALGVKLVRPDVIFAYPITPQTHIVETLSETAPSWGGRFINVESEFSAIASCPGAVLGMRHALKVMGRRTIVVMPACCWGIIAGPFPSTSLKVPLLQVPFAAGAPCRGSRVLSPDGNR